MNRDRRQRGGVRLEYRQKRDPQILCARSEIDSALNADTRILTVHFKMTALQNAAVNRSGRMNPVKIRPGPNAPRSLKVKKRAQFCTEKSPSSRLRPGSSGRMRPFRTSSVSEPFKSEYLNKRALPCQPRRPVRTPAPPCTVF